MKHRIYLQSDIEADLEKHAATLSVTPETLRETFQWMLTNDVVFIDGTDQQKKYAISSVDIEPVISHPLAKRFYHLLKQELFCTLVPLYGFNFPTLKDRWLRFWEQTYNILINKIPSHNIRLLWLKLGGAKIGKGSSIWRNTEILGIENLRMGDDSVIAWHCQVDARTGLSIGNHVSIASHVLIVAGTHDMAAPEFWSVSEPIIIDDYAWVASRAIIAQGAHLGAGCAVMANTLVAKKVAPYKIIGGSGAKVMGERPHNLNYRVNGKGLFTLFY